MLLSKNNFKNKITARPEKILQFGTGILLRGLPDYFIHQANEKGIYNGSIVIIKSTNGGTNEFDIQNNLFTTFIKGVEEGNYIEKTFINAAISEVLSAREQWNEILKVAENIDLEIIISNTTEVGIQYHKENIFLSPPDSFPAKLTSILFHRFSKTNGISKNLAIIPTELITENGAVLKKIIFQHITDNFLPAEFISWMEQYVIFCNSLVDRIVTSATENDISTLDYDDNLAIKTEPYKLWAIEGDERVKNILRFADKKEGLIIENDIEYYRERKLRILNGTHTISVCLGFWMDLNTVYECMQNELVREFIKAAMLEEIVPALKFGSEDENKTFAMQVLDRFNNPDLKHLLLNITMHQTAKMKMRNLPTIYNYYQKFNKVPVRMAMGFMAYLLFMRATHTRDGKYFGIRKEKEYQINDDKAPYFYEMWKDINIKDETAIKRLVLNICRNKEIWDDDLSRLPDFVETVSKQLIYLTQKL